MAVTPLDNYSANMDAVDAACRTALVRAGDYVAQRLQDKLNEKQKNATGQLSQSIVVTMPILTDHGWSVKIGPTAKHAVFVIHGRRPGARMPPVKAIENWLIQRGIQVHIDDAKTQEQAIRNAAWAIAKSISIKGISPFSFIDDVWKIEKSFVREMLRTDMKIAMKALGKSAKKG